MLLCAGLATATVSGLLRAAPSDPALRSGWPWELPSCGCSAIDDGKTCLGWVGLVETGTERVLHKR